MKNKKHVTIALVTAAFTLGGLSLAKAKVYKHHFEDRSGLYEKGQDKSGQCGQYFNEQKHKDVEQVEEE
jgi:hypothetical protein